MIGPFSIAKVGEYLPAEFVESSSVIKSCEPSMTSPFPPGRADWISALASCRSLSRFFPTNSGNQFVHNDGLNGGLEFWAEFTGVGSEEEFFVRKNFIRFALLRNFVESIEATGNISE